MKPTGKSNSYGNPGPSFYICTFGWPMAAVARDGAGDIKEDKCFGMNGLGKKSINFHNFNN
jgi:hypothetical protein